MAQSDSIGQHVFGTHQTPPALYQGFTTRSFYLSMRDGVRLAIDLHLPNGLSEGEKIPTLMTMTRYWRETELKAPFRWFFKPENLNPAFKNLKPFFTGQGYALLEVDERGTGASFGSWPYPWHPETIQDDCEILNWIISQKWSNGRVGTFGISYLGTTAELIPVCGHPAVKAAMPMFNHPDSYTDVAFPGGIFNERFIQAWTQMDCELDQNQVPQQLGWIARLMVKGVKPVEGARHELPKAIQAHSRNGNIYEAGRSITFRDDVYPALQVSSQDISVERFWPEIEKNGVPICGWGSWMDAGTADAVIRRFLSLENACMGVIGAWEHGGQFNASPYRSPKLPSDPNPEKQWMEIVRFFDPYLKENAVDHPKLPKLLHYYTMGEEKWKSTSTWPPEGMKTLRWYLGGGRRLALQQPGVEEKADRFDVDFAASSGLNNRWWELSSLERRSVYYRHRESADQHMLTYLSPPLEENLEISGYPIIKLFLTSTQADGAFIVYLEEIDEGGIVTYITEGQLRAMHRKVSPPPAGVTYPVPYHSFKQMDALPIEPGELTELHFGLLPTSVLIRRGHRLRLGIAGHDNGTFVRIPEQGIPTIHILHNQTQASYIEFPAAWKG